MCGGLCGGWGCGGLCGLLGGRAEGCAGSHVPRPLCRSLVLGCVIFTGKIECCQHEWCSKPWRVWTPLTQLNALPWLLLPPFAQFATDDPMSSPPRIHTLQYVSRRLLVWDAEITTLLAFYICQVREGFASLQHVSRRLRVWDRNSMKRRGASAIIILVIYFWAK